MTNCDVPLTGGLTQSDVNGPEIAPTVKEQRNDTTVCLLVICSFG